MEVMENLRQILLKFVHFLVAISKICDKISLVWFAFLKVFCETKQKREMRSVFYGLL